MPREVLRITSISMALSWLVVVSIGGVASLLALLVCWFFLGFGTEDSAKKHGISDTLSGRVGGVVVVGYTLTNLAYLSSTGSVSFDATLMAVAACCVGFFLLGLLEDLRGSTSAKLRLGLMLVVATYFVVSVPQLRLVSVNIPIIDKVLAVSPSIAIGFTSLCLAFLPNAFNTADGANGLVGGVSMLVLATMAISLPGGLSLLQMSAAVGCAIFLVFNIQTGRFFLGDGGAYSLGALVGCSMIYANQNYPTATWYLLSIVFYPIADLLWSMVRRFRSGVAVYEADNAHLHNLLHSYLRSRAWAAKSANNATGIIIVTLFCLFPILIRWFGFLGVDDVAWKYILLSQGAVYLCAWQFLNKRAVDDALMN